MTNKAQYRKLNDRSMNSSTYHKKEGTAVRANLKREAQQEAQEANNEGRLYAEHDEDGRYK